MSEDPRQPIDWQRQLQYLVLVVIGTIAFLLLLRYLKLR
jgi:hypothetical protein